ncbi:hypothetical protein NB693_20810 [Pantoea ananatis]|uniref:hypothetical protein n=1 Tax=Pantoea ananas TaxID=553 RepID=UPI00221FD975|nr:hypothetical protein [Pantoea ananatis]
MRVVTKPRATSWCAAADQVEPAGHTRRAGDHSARLPPERIGAERAIRLQHDLDAPDLDDLTPYTVRDDRLRIRFSAYAGHDDADPIEAVLAYRPPTAWMRR